jgi:L-rhamnonate dehydratase
VDLALWDVLGKLRREPVYALLGGKTKDHLPVYATTSRPDIAKSLGFVGAKISCAYGPAEGDRGLEKNIALFREARQKVGEDFPLMMDCFMSLTVPYALKLAKALEPVKLKWMEECLPPDNYSGYVELRQGLRGTTLVTTGEHEYTRYGYRQLLEGGCADILQPDITWVGGITEARSVASAYDIPVVPHGSSVYSYHLQYAFTNCPLAEYINLSPKGENIVPYFGGLFPDEPLPKDGCIHLPDRPGFGVTLDKTDLERPYPRHTEQVEKQSQRNRERSTATSAPVIMPL